MPVYNAEKYLELAINSIIEQSYQDFDLIIVNDGSIDGSLNILRKYETLDSRIKIINKKNEGIVSALNLAIKNTNAKYIARMDADDISHPDRFKEQLSYLRNNKNCVVVGCQCEFIDEVGNVIGKTSVPTKDNDIRCFIYYESPFVHPSVIINRSIAGELMLYKEEWRLAEDLDLWFRLLSVGMFGVVDKCLFKYRVFNSSLSGKNQSKQKDLDFKIRSTYYGESNICSLFFLNQIRFGIRPKDGFFCFLKEFFLCWKNSGAKFRLYFEIVARVIFKWFKAKNYYG